MNQENENADKILIVDDVPENLQLLEVVLLNEGYQTQIAKSGKEALTVVKNYSPDLILLDISMPEMDGYQVCEKLNKDPNTSDIPIIFLTALANSEYTVKGFQVGGVDYITKPFGTEELLARVKTHVELKKRRQQAEEDSKKLGELSQEQMLLNSILTQQKTEIEKKNKDLTDSIEYAKMIQYSLFPSMSRIEPFFRETMLIYKPKNQVSGDFYFFEKVGDRLVIFAADCTGHGVPGAFVSVLGFTLANQIIKHDKITEPSVIQQMLDSQLVSLLSDNYRNANSTDGMDVAICTFDFAQSKMWFSGSKRPLVIVRNNELIKIKSNLCSVGGYKSDIEKVFFQDEIDIKKNDIIYLFSDGFADQFGGPKIRKIGSKRFYNELFKKTETLEEKKNYLLNFLTKWQGDMEQIDDILVVGLKI